MKSPAPLALRDVLAPEWLTEALGQTIVSAEIVQTQKTIATKTRFRARREDGAAIDLCVKGMLDDGPLRPGVARMSQSETRFYRQIAPSAGVATPVVRYAGIDEGSGHGLILMEDVYAAGGRFLDPLEPYSPDRAATSLDQLALLHARHWDGAGLERHAWLSSRLTEFVQQPLRTPDELQALLDDPRGDRLDGSVRRADRLIRALGALAADVAPRTSCLVHGDAHAGNVVEIGGRTALADWQVLQRSTWALDVAYHIGAVLSIEDRRRTERALLEHYLNRLRSHGVDAPPWERAWTQFRAALVYGYYLWAITRQVDPAVTREFATRLGTAVADAESFDLLIAART
ncbi:MAG: aminoglycoside phosphotransferase family protein [Microbacterium sp.]